MKKDCACRRAAAAGREKACEAWFEGQLDLDPDRLVFIDETAATTKMARLRGRAPRGERCVAAVPHGHWKTTTLTAGLTSRGLVAPMVIDGPMDGPAFRAYVEKVLAPELRPGDVVVTDNLPAHKVAGVRQAIKRSGRACSTCRPTHPIQLDRSGVFEVQGASTCRGTANHSQAVGELQKRDRTIHAGRMPAYLAAAGYDAV